MNEILGILSSLDTLTGRFMHLSVSTPGLPGAQKTFQLPRLFVPAQKPQPITRTLSILPDLVSASIALPVS